MSRKTMYVYFKWSLPSSFRSGRTMLFSRKQRMRVPLAHSLATRFRPPSRNLRILTGVPWHYIVLLICIVLTTNTVEHFSLWLLALCILLWHSACSSLCIFKLSYFSLLIHRNSFYITDSTFCQTYVLHISSLVCGLLFHSLIGVFRRT